MTTPIVQKIEALLKERGHAVNDWFAQEYRSTPPNIYSSVDIRHSGIKIVPVDTNLFPAGFNHLSAAAQVRAVKQIQAFAARHQISAHKTLIIPENHTRNQGYIDNLAALMKLFDLAGHEVQVGSLMATPEAPIQVASSHGVAITQHALVKDGNLLRTSSGFTPDLIVVNNDLTSGFPDILRGITQFVAPPLGQGWYRRRKTIHFDAYEKVAQQFCARFHVDPWLITAAHHKCGLVDFHERKGLDCVAEAVEKMLTGIREKYREYGVEEEPYAYVKADSGTYGMGIMSVRSGAEVVEMNKRTRNKMDVIKEGVQSTEVIIQEGIPTVDVVNGHPAEPMMYLVNGYTVGGSYRFNAERDRYSNLNASGMSFTGMCDPDEKPDESHVKVMPCAFKVFGLLAQIATLAASREEYGEGYSI